MAVIAPAILAMDITIKDIVWAVVGLLGAWLTYFLGRKKMNSEVHKTDSESFNLNANKFLELLEKIEIAHKQALEDDAVIAQLKMTELEREKEIAHLRQSVQECLDGHKDWIECKDEALRFLFRVEREIQEPLLSQAKTIRTKFESLAM